MNAYAYQAELLCERCAKGVMYELGADKDDGQGDSDDYPKGPWSDGGGEADGPQHCGKCSVFLENPLTDEGYRYVKLMLDGKGDNPSDKARGWAEFYGFSRFENPYVNAHEWLDQHIDKYVEMSDGRLVQLAKELAHELDADKIQDLYQSDMDDDDFFKLSGWYSDQWDG